MPKVWLSIFCLCLFLFYNQLSVNADEKPIPTDKPTEKSTEKPVEKPTEKSVDEKKEEIFHLSMRDTIERTLRNNVTITVQAITPKIKEKAVTDQESQFDLSVIGLVNAAKTKQQVASVFASPNVSSVETGEFMVGVKQKIETGGNYLLTFDNLGTGSNSHYAPLIPMYTSTINLTFTQPLLKNFGVDINKTNIYVAQNDVKVSEFDFKGQVINIIANAQNAYWDFYFSVESLRIAEKSYERARDQERTIRAQVSAGTMAPLEIIGAQAEVAARDELVIAAKKQVTDTEEILKNTLNIQFESKEGRTPIRPIDPPQFIIKDKVDLEAALKEAFENRPDYLGMKKNLESKNIIIKYNQNQLYPEIDFVGNAGLNGMAGTPKDILYNGTDVFSPWNGGLNRDLGYTLSRDYYQWAMGLTLSYPLGNRSAESRLAASQLDAEQLLTNIKDLEKTIVVSVREAIRRITTAIKNVPASQLARKLAEERLIAEQKKFKVGLSTSFNVLLLQETLATQEGLEIKAVIDYNKALINLDQVLGRTLETNNIQLATRTIK